MSATGRRRLPRGARDGFTLVELLVVLAILGLALTLAPFLLPQQRDQAVLAAAAEEVAATLRRARSLAISGVHATEVRFELEAGRYRAPWMAGPRALPEGVALSWLSAAGRPRAEGAVAFRFGTDGSPDAGSPVGMLQLRLDDRFAAVQVDWLTGRVARVAEAGER